MSMPIRIEERDRYLLKLLAKDFLLLSREQIQELIPRGKRRTNQRLALLTGHRCLAKREPEDALSPSLTFYYLGENAGRVLEDTDGVKPGGRAKNFGDSYLRHLHLINSVHIKFMTAKARGYQFLAWVSSDNKEWDEIPRLKLRPDGFLRFRKDRQEFCYFIEVDRGTERGESIRKKIREYHDFDLSGDFRQVFKRDWFRALFVASEESGCKRLLKLFPSDAFWVASAADISSKGILDGYWASKRWAGLSLCGELEPGRRERIAAQKEAELHQNAPEAPKERVEVVRALVTSVHTAGGVAASRVRAIPLMAWLKIAGAFAPQETRRRLLRRRVLDGCCHRETKFPHHGGEGTSG